MEHITFEPHHGKNGWIFTILAVTSAIVRGFSVNNITLSNVSLIVMIISGSMGIYNFYIATKMNKMNIKRMEKEDAEREAAKKKVNLN